MLMEVIYLGWVDFLGIGMLCEEFIKWVEKDVWIVVNYGLIFGKGGENFLWFNFVILCSVV